MKKFIFIILLIPSIVFGADYHVKKTGDNGNVGSEASPWLTIQKCADTIIAGDTCIVHAGIYNETVTETTDGAAGNYITYVANPHLGVTMRGFDVTGLDYIRIVGFEITHLTTEAHSITATGGTYNQFLYNYIHHVNSGILLDSTTTSYNIVRGNTIEFTICPASGPCMGGGTVSVKGASNLIEYNNLAHVSDYFALSATANVNGYNIFRNNYLGHCYFSDFPDNTHTDENAECTANDTASDFTGEYYPSCCSGAGTGTCTARHIDELQENALVNYILFEKNYHEYGADSDITDRHGLLARLANNVGMKLRDNLFSRVLTSWYSGGSGFRLYNNTTVNSKSASTAALNYGSHGQATDGKAFNNLYYNATAAANNWPYAITITEPVSELIADYDLWYGYTAYYLAAGYQAPSTWEGGASQVVNSDPTLNSDYSIPVTSPAKGAGVTATLANGAGVATTTLIVDDAQPFVGQDWGVVDASGSAYGDTIVIGTNDPVIITAINYATDTITIASAQSWDDNAPIRLYSHNSDMDIGAYPYRAGGYTLTGTWALNSGIVTVTPSDSNLVRFVEVLEDGKPIGVDYTSPYTVSGVGSGTVTVKLFSLYASETPIITATEGAGGSNMVLGAGAALTIGSGAAITLN